MRSKNGLKTLFKLLDIEERHIMHPLVVKNGLRVHQPLGGLNLLAGSIGKKSGISLGG